MGLRDLEGRRQGLQRFQVGGVKSQDSDMNGDHPSHHHPMRRPYTWSLPYGTGCRRSAACVGPLPSRMSRGQANGPWTVTVG